MILCSFPKAQTATRRAAIDAAVKRVLDGDYYILGPEVAAFERELAEHTGTPFAVGVNSGTDAISIALQALGIGAGDEVITVSHTALATVAAICLTGATPVLVDIDSISRTISPAAVKSAITARTRAVVPVHLYGQPCDMDAILAIAAEHGLKVVEDCAQAQGAAHNGRRAGSMGDAGCFSFYPTKNLGAIGDGGGLVMKDAEVHARALQLRQYGWDKERVSRTNGCNSRLDELQAAILRAKLPFLEQDNARRAAISARYDAELAGLGLALPPRIEGTAPAYHLYVVETPRRDVLMAHLAQAGIAAGIHYALPAHAHPGYAGRVVLPPGGLPETEALVSRILTLPIYPELDETQVGTVIRAVRDGLA